MILFRVFFSAILAKKYFLTAGNHFQFFLPEEAVFPYNGIIFFNNCLIPFLHLDFMASTKNKLLIHLLVETFFKESFILLEKDFFLIGNRLLYLKVLSC